MVMHRLAVPPLGVLHSGDSGAAARLVAKVPHRGIPAALVALKNGRRPQVRRDLEVVVALDPTDGPRWDVQVVAGGGLNFARKPSVVRGDLVGAVGAQLGVRVVRVVVGNLCELGDV